MTTLERKVTRLLTEAVEENEPHKVEEAFTNILFLSEANSLCDSSRVSLVGSGTGVGGGNIPETISPYIYLYCAEAAIRFNLWQIVKHCVEQLQAKSIFQSPNGSNPAVLAANDKNAVPPSVEEVRNFASPSDATLAPTWTDFTVRTLFVEGALLSRNMIEKRGEQLVLAARSPLAKMVRGISIALEANRTVLAFAGIQQLWNISQPLYKVGTFPVLTDVFAFVNKALDASNVHEPELRSMWAIRLATCLSATPGRENDAVPVIASAEQYVTPRTIIPLARASISTSLSIASSGAAAGEKSSGGGGGGKGGNVVGPTAAALLVTAGGKSSSSATDKSGTSQMNTGALVQKTLQILQDASSLVPAALQNGGVLPTTTSSGNNKILLDDLIQIMKDLTQAIIQISAEQKQQSSSSSSQKTRGGGGSGGPTSPTSPTSKRSGTPPSAFEGKSSSGSGGGGKSGGKDSGAVQPIEGTLEELLAECSLLAAFLGALPEASQVIDRCLVSRHHVARVYAELANAVTQAQRCGGVLLHVVHTDTSRVGSSSPQVIHGLTSSVRRIEITLEGALRIQDRLLRNTVVERCATTMWNLALPLLNPQTRLSITKSLKSAVRALETVGSTNNDLICLLQHEIALHEADQQFTSKAADRLDSCLKIDVSDNNSSVAALKFLGSGAGEFSFTVGKGEGKGGGTSGGGGGGGKGNASFASPEAAAALILSSGPLLSSSPNEVTSVFHKEHERWMKYQLRSLQVKRDLYTKHPENPELEALRILQQAIDTNPDARPPILARVMSILESGVQIPSFPISYFFSNIQQQNEKQHERQTEKSNSPTATATSSNAIFLFPSPNNTNITNTNKRMMPTDPDSWLETFGANTLLDLIYYQTSAATAASNASTGGGKGGGSSKQKGGGGGSKNVPSSPDSGRRRGTTVASSISAAAAVEDSINQDDQSSFSVDPNQPTDPEVILQQQWERTQMWSMLRSSAWSFPSNASLELVRRVSETMLPVVSNDREVIIEQIRVALTHAQTFVYEANQLGLRFGQFELDEKSPEELQTDVKNFQRAVEGCRNAEIGFQTMLIAAALLSHHLSVTRSFKEERWCMMNCFISLWESFRDSFESGLYVVAFPAFQRMMPLFLQVVTGMSGSDAANIAASSNAPKSHGGGHHGKESQGNTSGSSITPINFSALPVDSSSSFSPLPQSCETDLISNIGIASVRAALQQYVADCLKIELSSFSGSSLNASRNQEMLTTQNSNQASAASAASATTTQSSSSSATQQLQQQFHFPAVGDLRRVANIDFTRFSPASSSSFQHDPTSPLLTQASQWCEALIPLCSPADARELCKLSVVIRRYQNKPPENRSDPVLQITTQIELADAATTSEDRSMALVQAVELLQSAPSIELCSRVADACVCYPGCERLCIASCAIGQELYVNGKLGKPSKQTSLFTSSSGSGNTESGGSGKPMKSPRGGGRLSSPDSDNPDKMKDKLSSSVVEHLPPDSEDWMFYTIMLQCQGCASARLSNGSSVDSSTAEKILLRSLENLANGAAAATRCPPNQKCQLVAKAVALFKSATDELTQVSHGSSSAIKTMLPSLRAILSPPIISIVGPLLTDRNLFGSSGAAEVAPSLSSDLSRLMLLMVKALHLEELAEEGLAFLLSALKVLPNTEHKAFWNLDAAMRCNTGAPLSSTLIRVKEYDVATQAQVWAAIARNAPQRADQLFALSQAVKVFDPHTHPLEHSTHLVSLATWLFRFDDARRVALHDIRSMMVRALDLVWKDFSMLHIPTNPNNKYHFLSCGGGGGNKQNANVVGDNVSTYSSYYSSSSAITTTSGFDSQTTTGRGSQQTSTPRSDYASDSGREFSSSSLGSKSLRGGGGSVGSKSHHATRSEVARMLAKANQQFSSDHSNRYDPLLARVPDSKTLVVLLECLASYCYVAPIQQQQQSSSSSSEQQSNRKNTASSSSSSSSFITRQDALLMAHSCVITLWKNTIACINPLLQREALAKEQRELREQLSAQMMNANQQQKDATAATPTTTTSGHSKPSSGGGRSGSGGGGGKHKQSNTPPTSGTLSGAVENSASATVENMNSGDNQQQNLNTNITATATGPSVPLVRIKPTVFVLPTTASAWCNLKLTPSFGAALLRLKDHDAQPLTPSAISDPTSFCCALELIQDLFIQSEMEALAAPIAALEELVVTYLMAPSHLQQVTLQNCELKRKCLSVSLGFVSRRDVSSCLRASSHRCMNLLSSSFQVIPKQNNNKEQQQDENENVEAKDNKNISSSNTNRYSIPSAVNGVQALDTATLSDRWVRILSTYRKLDPVGNAVLTLARDVTSLCSIVGDEAGLNRALIIAAHVMQQQGQAARAVQVFHGISYTKLSPREMISSCCDEVSVLLQLNDIPAATAVLEQLHRRIVLLTKSSSNNSNNESGGEQIQNTNNSTNNNNEAIQQFIEESLGSELQFVFAVHAAEVLLNHSNKPRMKAAMCDAIHRFVASTILSLASPSSSTTIDSNKKQQQAAAANSSNNTENENEIIVSNSVAQYRTAAQLLWLRISEVLETPHSSETSVNPMSGFNNEKNTKNISPQKSSARGKSSSNKTTTDSSSSEKEQQQEAMTAKLVEATKKSLTAIRNVTSCIKFDLCGNGETIHRVAGSLVEDRNTSFFADNCLSDLVSNNTNATSNDNTTNANDGNVNENQDSSNTTNSSELQQYAQNIVCSVLKSSSGSRIALLQSAFALLSNEITQLASLRRTAVSLYRKLPHVAAISYPTVESAEKAGLGNALSSFMRSTKRTRRAEAKHRGKQQQHQELDNKRQLVRQERAREVEARRVQKKQIEEQQASMPGGARRAAAASKQQSKFGVSAIPAHLMTEIDFGFTPLDRTCGIPSPEPTDSDEESLDEDSQSDDDKEVERACAEVLRDCGLNQSSLTSWAHSALLALNASPLSFDDIPTQLQSHQQTYETSSSLIVEEPEDELLRHISLPARLLRLAPDESSGEIPYLFSRTVSAGDGNVISGGGMSGSNVTGASSTGEKTTSSKTRSGGGGTTRSRDKAHGGTSSPNDNRGDNKNADNKNAASQKRRNVAFLQQQQNKKGHPIPLICNCDRTGIEMLEQVIFAAEHHARWKLLGVSLGMYANVVAREHPPPQNPSSSALSYEAQHEARVARLLELSQASLMAHELRKVWRELVESSCSERVGIESGADNMNNLFIGSGGDSSSNSRMIQRLSISKESIASVLSYGIAQQRDRERDGGVSDSLLLLSQQQQQQQSQTPNSGGPVHYLTITRAGSNYLSSSTITASSDDSHDSSSSSSIFAVLRRGVTVVDLRTVSISIEKVQEIFQNFQGVSKMRHSVLSKGTSSLARQEGITLAEATFKVAMEEFQKVFAPLLSDFELAFSAYHARNTNLPMLVLNLDIEFQPLPWESISFFSNVKNVSSSTSSFAKGNEQQQEKEKDSSHHPTFHHATEKEKPSSATSQQSAAAATAGGSPNIIGSTSPSYFRSIVRDLSQYHCASRQISKKFEVAQIQSSAAVSGGSSSSGGGGKSSGGGGGSGGATDKNNPLQQLQANSPNGICLGIVDQSGSSGFNATFDPASDADSRPRGYYWKNVSSPVVPSPLEGAMSHVESWFTRGLQGAEFGSLQPTTIFYTASNSGRFPSVVRSSTWCSMDLSHVRAAYLLDGGMTHTSAVVDEAAQVKSATSILESSHVISLLMLARGVEFVVAPSSSMPLSPVSVTQIARLLTKIASGDIGAEKTAGAGKSGGGGGGSGSSKDVNNSQLCSAISKATSELLHNAIVQSQIRTTSTSAVSGAGLQQQESMISPITASTSGSLQKEQSMATTKSHGKSSHGKGGGDGSTTSAGGALDNRPLEIYDSEISSIAIWGAVI